MGLRTVVVGFGFAGEFFHCPLVAASSELELVGVVSSKPEDVVREKLKNEKLRCFPTLQAAVDALDVELAVVATPNEAHYQCAADALQLGLHVVIDKPFTVTSAEGASLIALAAKQGRKLSCFQNRRWDSDFLTVQRVLPQLGEVRYYSSRWQRFRPEVQSSWRWQPEQGAAGLLWDLGAHLFDQVLVLFGRPSAVQCVLAQQRTDARGPDYFSCHFFFDARPQLVCRVEAGLFFRPTASSGERSFRLEGATGSFDKPRGIDNQERLMRSGVPPTAEGFGEEPAEEWGRLADGETVPAERGCYAAGYYDAVGRALRDGTALPVTAEEGLTVVRLLEAAEESARTGARVTFD